MSDEPVPPPHPRAGPPTSPDTAAQRTTGRCDQCGYSLTGLPWVGTCPECGSGYTSASAARLKPWPGALEVCLRLGWPIIVLLFLGAMMMSGNDAAMVAGVFGTWAMMVALALNSYLQVRWMLKRSLPEQTRTRGPVAILRAIGTTICVVVLLLFVGGPLLGAAACLIMLSRP